MSSPNGCYSLVTLSDHVVPGFAGIMRASMLARQSRLAGEIKVVVAGPARVAQGRAIRFAKMVTKHIRVSRGWSFVNANVQSMEIQDLPSLGTPQQTRGNLTAWIVG
jgi:hypothetical protein